MSWVLVPAEKLVFGWIFDRHPAWISSGVSSGMTDARAHNPRDSFELKVGHVFVGNKGVYKVEEFLGEGSFGKVAKCSKFRSLEVYAVKIMKISKAGQKEFEAMKLIQDLDPDENHLIKIIGVAHCDIKLDNIMFADLDVMNVKLIDFGLAVETKELLTETDIQVTPFRAPEVILGLPLDESVDMWALGMVLACVYSGNYLFPSRTEYETIRAMVLCTPEEYTEATGVEVRHMDHVIDFDAMTNQHRNMYKMHDDDDHKAFIDLLKRILEVNPQRRITPSQALEHDFITMKHLAGKSKAAYAAGCKGVMKMTPQSEAQVNPSASSSSDGEIVDMRKVPSAGSSLINIVVFC
uniref:Protein kinase domain-containing protein n=1 Tax=Oryzias sinensis TaxID=183150 RepID=A0A8C7ZIS4_9TELE